MLPTFKSGTVLVGAATYILKPKIGLPVVFRHGNRIYIKRIKKTSRNSSWVEGDNKDLSNDSRSFGYVSSNSIMAVIFFRLWG